MRHMRLAICVAVFALVGGIATSQDLDIRALQAKLAAQEARLNDLQAKVNASKYTNEVEGVISIKKNAVVTIGGTVNTRYFYHKGKVDTALVDYSPANPAPGRAYRPAEGVSNKAKWMDYKIGDFKVSDAKLRVQVDVNDYFDAFLQMDVQDSSGNRADAAQKYYIRWKNVCNSGFGLIVGRNDLIFGGGNPSGAIASGWVGAGDWFDKMAAPAFFTTGANAGVYGLDPTLYGGVNPRGGVAGDGMFGSWGSLMPAHTGWDYNRTTQINPYWENQCKTFKIEASIFQGLDRMHGTVNNYERIQGYNSSYGTYKSFDAGPLSASARITWKPIEGLKLQASVVNFRNDVNYTRLPGATGLRGVENGIGGYAHGDIAKNNTAVNASFEYRPCFFNRLNLFAQWTHGWNEHWVKDLDSDIINYGLTFDITEQLTFFGYGDFMKIKNKRLGGVWYKASGWAGYAGLRYKLPYGVTLEGGYRHEQISFKDRVGLKHTKAKMDTVYAHLGFDF